MDPEPGALDNVIDALGEFAPVVVAGLGAVVALALTVVLVKWGVPQLIGFFKKLAK